MNIKDKVAIVTGASSGIGLATAKLLSFKGAKVALVARSKEKLAEISKQIPNSVFFVADMSKVQEIKNMVKYVKNHFGAVDILINNAGQGYDSVVEKIDIDTFHKIFDLDVVGPLVAMQQVIPMMRQQGGGTIVNISSGTALMYLPNMSAYSSMKRALAAISLTAREELKKDRIKVSVVYPYITDTDFEKHTIKDREEINEAEDNNDFKLPNPDSADYVAGKIFDAITFQEGEIFAHDWMKNQKR